MRSTKACCCSYMHLYWKTLWPLWLLFFVLLVLTGVDISVEKSNLPYQQTNYHTPSLIDIRAFPSIVGIFRAVPVTDLVFASIAITEKRNFDLIASQYTFVTARDAPMFSQFFSAWMPLDGIISTQCINRLQFHGCWNEGKESDDAKCCFSSSLYRSPMTIVDHHMLSWWQLKSCTCQRTKPFSRRNKRKTGEDKISPVICSV